MVKSDCAIVSNKGSKLTALVLGRLNRQVVALWTCVTSIELELIDTNMNEIRAREHVQMFPGKSRDSPVCQKNTFPI